MTTLQHPLQPGYALAFYVGEGDWTDAVVRYWTGSRCSHVELLWLPSSTWPMGPMVSVSASPRDRGVRIKAITYDPRRWEIVSVPWARSDAWARAEAEVGTGYDWPGVVLRHGLGLPVHLPGRWFCSELCAMAVGLAGWDTWTPGEMHAAMAQRRRTHSLKR
jgi:hypothetical protein